MFLQHTSTPGGFRQSKSVRARWWAQAGRVRGPLGSLCVLLVALWGCAPQPQRELKPGEKTITLMGAVVPFQEAKVTSATTGVVARLLVQPGQPVEAGAILLKLEPTTAIAEVDRAEAALMVARTSLQQAQSGGNKAELATAEAEVLQLEHEAQRLQGQQQRPRATNERGQTEIILFNARLRLQRMYDLHARGLVSRPELEGAENEYAEASRRFQAEGEAASVEHFQRIADPKTQALAVTFTLPNPDYKFQPGFTAKVELPVKQEALK